MKPRKVRRTDSGQLGSQFEPYYRREGGSDRSRPWRKWLVRGLKLGLLLLIASFVMAWGFVIENVRITDSAYATEVEAAARSLLANNRGWNNQLFLPADELAANLQARYNDKITDVRVNKKWLTKGITIKVTDRSPQLVWQSNRQLFTVDQTGRVIGQVGERPPGLPLVVDTSNIELVVNSQVAPSQFVEFTQAVFNNMAATAGVNPAQGRIEQTTNELLVDTAAGYFVRFDTTGSANEQLQSVKLASTEATAKGQPISSYIDVRLPYKLFYR